MDEVYILSSSQDDPSLIDSDYQMIIEVKSIDHWTQLEEFLSANQQSSGCSILFLLWIDHYTLKVNFNQSYKTLPLTSFEGLTSLLTLKPMRFHGSIHHIARYLSLLEPPTLELCDTKGNNLFEYANH